MDLNGLILLGRSGVIVYSNEGARWSMKKLGEFLTWIVLIGWIVFIFWLGEYI